MTEQPSPAWALEQKQQAVQLFYMLKRPGRACSQWDAENMNCMLTVQALRCTEVLRYVLLVNGGKRVPQVQFFRCNIKSTCFELRACVVHRNVCVYDCQGCGLTIITYPQKRNDNDDDYTPVLRVHIIAIINVLIC